MREKKFLPALAIEELPEESAAKEGAVTHTARLALIIVDTGLATFRVFELAHRKLARGRGGETCINPVIEKVAKAKFLIREISKLAAVVDIEIWLKANDPSGASFCPGASTEIVAGDLPEHLIERGYQEIRSIDNPAVVDFSQDAPVGRRQDRWTLFLCPARGIAVVEADIVDLPL